MSSEYAKRILNDLVDKYESSKSFKGTNRVAQSFKTRIPLLFEAYGDHARYEIFRDVNETVDLLERKGLIRVKTARGTVHDEIYLNLDRLEAVYRYLGRTPKREIQQRIRTILQGHLHDNPILHAFCLEQLNRLEENRPVAYFKDDYEEFDQVLRAVKEVWLVEKEQFIREFSIRVFKDSKAFGRIQGKVERLLYDYGDFPDKDQVLAGFNLVKTPTYVNYKGAGRIRLAGQEIDLSRLSGDVAVSSSLLGDIDRLEVLGEKVITIENLTSFHRFNEPGFFIIYLGGFHNKVRRDFIEKLYKENPDKHYYHFGDIDAGGFRILEHLKNKTGVPFKPYLMDEDTLIKYREFTKKLTQNDRSNLEKLLVHEAYESVIRFMLKMDCKLEQEAVNQG